MFRATLLIICVIALLSSCDADRRKVGRSKKMVSGLVTAPHAHPYQVALIYQEIPYCGGSIIHVNYVLTAAHCFDDAPAAESTVVAGVHDWTEPSESWQIRTFKNHNHDKYKRGNFDYDVSVLHVKEAFKVNDFVKVIKLNTDGVYPTGKVIITGWGHLCSDLDILNKPHFLQKGEFEMLPHDECVKRWTGSGITFPDTNICYIKENSKTNPCQGDSGGPIVQFVNGEFIQVAVLHFVHTSCSNQRPPAGMNLSKVKDFLTITTASKVRAMADQDEIDGNFADMLNF